MLTASTVTARKRWNAKFPPRTRIRLATTTAERSSPGKSGQRPVGYARQLHVDDDRSAQPVLDSDDLRLHQDRSLFSALEVTTTAPGNRRGSTTRREFGAPGPECRRLGLSLGGHDSRAHHRRVMYAPPRGNARGESKSLTPRPLRQRMPFSYLAVSPILADWRGDVVAPRPSFSSRVGAHDLLTGMLLLEERGSSVWAGAPSPAPLRRFVGPARVCTLPDCEWSSLRTRVPGVEWGPRVHREEIPELDGSNPGPRILAHEGDPMSHRGRISSWPSPAALSCPARSSPSKLGSSLTLCLSRTRYVSNRSRPVDLNPGV